MFVVHPKLLHEIPPSEVIVHNGAVLFGIYIFLQYMIFPTEFTWNTGVVASGIDNWTAPTNPADDTVNNFDTELGMESWLIYVLALLNVHIPVKVLFPARGEYNCALTNAVVATIVELVAVAGVGNVLANPRKALDVASRAYGVNDVAVIYDWFFTNAVVDTVVELSIVAGVGIVLVPVKILLAFNKAKLEEVKFNIGDSVRYILNRKQFEKGTLAKWSKTVHKIKSNT